jgi:hypothetical protein
VYFFIILKKQAMFCLLSLYIDQNRFNLFMKFLKTFENFDESALPCCPTCSSDNISSVNGSCECIDCGEAWSDGETFDEPVMGDDAENMLPGESVEGEPIPAHDPNMLDDSDDIADAQDDEMLAPVMDDEEELPRRRVGSFADFSQEDEEIMDDHLDDVPALSDDEEDQYFEESDVLANIVQKAKEMDVELGDQLEYLANEVDDLTEFKAQAVAAIQDVKGIDREEAEAILSSLM